jgi:preprotein translocase subunit SecF
VHDTIVVFDRIRENLARQTDPTFEGIVNYSLAQTIVRSVNTSLTVVFTLLALFLFGGESTRTFVLALLIGVVSGTYSSIFNASQLLVSWEEHDFRKWWDQLRKRSPEPQPSR